MNDSKLKYFDSTPLPHNFLAEQGVLNILLTNPALDPYGKIPEFKYCAAKIETL